MPRVHPQRVDDQDDGNREELGECGARVPPFEVNSVMEALVALDQREIRRRPACRNALKDFRIRVRIEVEIVAGPAARMSEPHRIDIIRPLLEGLHGQSARGERCGKPDRQGRFPRGFMRGGNKNASHDYATARSRSRPCHMAFACA